nr:MAG TPA: hypothetical protein [Crassvirales sp.]DAR74780.1 MAG TPA: hypothetical protein [Crassvirales sp.]
MKLQGNTLYADEGKYITDKEETGFYTTICFPTKPNMKDYKEVEAEYAEAKMNKNKEDFIVKDDSNDFDFLGMDEEDYITAEEAEEVQGNEGLE